jgi:hypothetical protein
LRDDISLRIRLAKSGAAASNSAHEATRENYAERGQQPIEAVVGRVSCIEL